MRLPQKSILLFVALAMAMGAPRLAASADGTDEEALGKQYDQEIAAQMGFVKDAKVRDYVARVGKKVLSQVHDPGFEFQFKVVDDEMVNAFALPGGYVYVARGMLAALNDEAELAGVLGHEIGHVIGHHSVKQMQKNIAQALVAIAGLIASPDIRNNAGAWLTVTQTMGMQIITGYGRENEMESDQEGLILAAAAGYDPRAIVSFLKTMQGIERLGFQTYHGFMATHPDTISRIVDAETKSQLLVARDSSPKERYRDRYLDNIAGLRYGKPRWKGRTLPPYEIAIHTVKEGETFRSIASGVARDMGKAFEIAAINGMELNTPLTPGMRVKAILPAAEMNVKQEREEERKYEIGVRIGDGKGGQTGRGGDGKADHRPEGRDSSNPQGGGSQESGNENNDGR
jgi:predicted Zn-dependent protease